MLLLVSQVKALNGLIREVTGIKPHAFWKPLEANGDSGKGKRAGVALNRPNKKKYRKGLPWQRHNGFGHRIRKFVVKYALSPRADVCIQLPCSSVALVMYWVQSFTLMHMLLMCLLNSDRVLVSLGNTPMGDVAFTALQL